MISKLEHYSRGTKDEDLMEVKQKQSAIFFFRAMGHKTKRTCQTNQPVSQTDRNKYNCC